MPHNVACFSGPGRSFVRSFCPEIRDIIREFQAKNSKNSRFLSLTIVSGYCWSQSKGREFFVFTRRNSIHSCLICPFREVTASDFSSVFYADRCLIIDHLALYRRKFCPINKSAVFTRASNLFCLLLCFFSVVDFPRVVQSIYGFVCGGKRQLRMRIYLPPQFSHRICRNLFVFGPVSIAIGKNFTPVEFNATFFGLIIE
jgi:hypothetical protein